MKKNLIKAAYAGVASLLAAPVLATTSVQQGISDVNPGNNNVPQSLPSSVQTIADTLIYIVGAVAVLMLIIGGLRYVISQGDSAAVKQAKDTILYGIIGVVVAILAYAIVAFIAGALAP